MGHNTSAKLQRAHIRVTPGMVINSPRYIANGQGAWQGTVREAVQWENQKDTGDTAHGILDRMRADGRLTQDREIYSEGWMLSDDGGVEPDSPEDHPVPNTGLDDVIDLLELYDLSEMLDDPNVEIVE